MPYPLYPKPAFLTPEAYSQYFRPMTRRFESPKPVRRTMIVRFDVSLRRALDQIRETHQGYAKTSKHGSEEPRVLRDAELVRLLLVCAILGHEASTAARIAVALCVNVEIALAPALAQLAGGLRVAVLDVTQRIAEEATGLDADSSKRAQQEKRELADLLHSFLEQRMEPQATLGTRHARPRTADDKDGNSITLQPDRTRVNLVLDGWLFRAVERFAESPTVVGRQPRSLGSEAVRQLLARSVRDYSRSHRQVIEGYMRTLARVDAIGRDAVASSRAALTIALREAATEK